MAEHIKAVAIVAHIRSSNSNNDTSSSRQHEEEQAECGLFLAFMGKIWISLKHIDIDAIIASIIGIVSGSMFD